MSSIFTKIVNGEIPAIKVAEDEHHLAFLDIGPVAHGHTLVIPKLETDYIFDIADPEFAALWLFAKKVARALGKAVPCKRVGITVIGLEVPHAHIHLVPMNIMADINFSKPKLSPSQAALDEVAEAIKEKLAEQAAE
ncbi:MAG: HIT family protein [Bacteroidota bacterium]